MIDAVSRDGFVIAQEYLPAAEQGDMRLFVMNGRPLCVGKKYAAFRRVRSGGDMRSNVHAGGTKAAAEIDSTVLQIAEIVRPKLVQDGMFLVGLDIVGDKLMEINVFSPGGLGSAQQFEKVNFSVHVIEAIERKVQYMQFYGRNFDNVDMCTLCRMIHAKSESLLIHPRPAKSPARLPLALRWKRSIEVMRYGSRVRATCCTTSMTTFELSPVRQAGRYASVDKLHDAMHGRAGIEKTITIDDLDVLLLRNNPSAQREWAQDAGIHFGRLAMRRGVIVLSDPNGLAKASKQTLP